MDEIERQELDARFERLEADLIARIERLENAVLYSLGLEDLPSGADLSELFNPRKP